MSPVYRSYDQNALDNQYKVSRPALQPLRDARAARTDAASDAVRRERPRLLDFVYGIHEREKLDIYPTEDDFAPLVVFIHIEALARLRTVLLREKVRFKGMSRSLTVVALTRLVEALYARAGACAAQPLESPSSPPRQDRHGGTPAQPRCVPAQPWRGRARGA